MSNLRYFFHYHQGDAKEKTIKIAGSFLIASMLFTWAFSAQISKAAQEYNELTATLLPEPGYMIAAELAQNTEMPAPDSSGSSGGQSQPTPMVSPEQPATSITNTTTVVAPPVPDSTASQPVQQTCRVDGKDMPGPCENYQPKEEFNNKEGMNNNDEEREQFEQERQKQELERWKADRLRDAKNFLREVEKVRKQMIRLKGSADEVAKIDAMKATVTEFVNKINATKDEDDLRDILEDSDFGDSWDELNQLRAAVEIPKQLNNLRKDQKRAKTILKQKWVCKLVDCAQVTLVTQNMDAALEQITSLYKAGELEDAQETIRSTFDELGWYGDLMGALQMMRGFLDPLKQIRNVELRADMEATVWSVRDLLYGGEVRAARESMEVIQKELGPSMFKMIMNAQKKKQAVPESVLEKIEQLRQRFEQQPIDEAPTAPTEIAP